MADRPDFAGESLAMRAWRAMHGDANPQQIGEFFEWAVNRLRELPERPYLTAETADFIADLIMNLESVAHAINSEVPTAFELVLKPRNTGGRPRLPRAEMRQRNEAARLASKYLADGAKRSGPPELWLRLLAEWTGNDAALFAYWQRLCGYVLTGSTKEHQLFFLHGPGGNGILPSGC